MKIGLTVVACFLSLSVGGCGGGDSSVIDAAATVDAVGATIDAAPAVDSGPAANHALITEIGLAPAGVELVEIMNTGSTALDLGDFYLSDNAAYHEITAGTWAPIGTPETDWVVRFPVGASLAGGAVAVIALGPGYEAQWGSCPDFIISPTETDLACGATVVPAMRIPANGSVGTNVGSLLSNSGEMVILFSWDGVASTVSDVDYVTFDPDVDPGTHVDKTAVTGYAPDTAEASQMPAPLAPVSQTLERCDATEPGETTTGGNGIGGHDETSENLSASFRATASSTPGTVNPCL